MLARLRRRRCQLHMARTAHHLHTCQARSRRTHLAVAAALRHTRCSPWRRRQLSLRPAGTRYIQRSLPTPQSTLPRSLHTTLLQQHSDTAQHHTRDNSSPPSPQTARHRTRDRAGRALTRLLPRSRGIWFLAGRIRDLKANSAVQSPQCKAFRLTPYRLPVRAWTQRCFGPCRVKPAHKGICPGREGHPALTS